MLKNVEENVKEKKVFCQLIHNCQCSVVKCIRPEMLNSRIG